MFDLRYHIAGQDLWVVNNLGDLVYRAAGHPALDDQRDPVVRGLSPENLGQRAHALVPVFHPVGVGSETWVFQEIGPANAMAKAFPESLVGTT